MKVEDIPKYEESINFNINVFEMNQTVLTPIYISKHYSEEQKYKY